LDLATTQGEKLGAQVGTANWAGSGLVSLPGTILRIGQTMRRNIKRSQNTPPCGKGDNLDGGSGAEKPNPERKALTNEGYGRPKGETIAGAVVWELGRGRY